VYDYIIYILYYILAYTQHNGDISLGKKNCVKVFVTGHLTWGWDGYV